MASLVLTTTNGSVTLTAEDGSGNADVTIPRAGIGDVSTTDIANMLETTDIVSTVQAWLS
jgi:hypothetical protein